MAYERARVAIDDEAPPTPTLKVSLTASDHRSPSMPCTGQPNCFSFNLITYPHPHPLQSSLKKSVTVQCTPTEVFHYADSRGQCDASNLNRSNSILQAAKKDLLGIIQLQVAPPPAATRQIMQLPSIESSNLSACLSCRTRSCWRAELLSTRSKPDLWWHDRETRFAHTLNSNKPAKQMNKETRTVSQCRI